MAFLELCEDEIRKGNRPGSHFNSDGWKNLLNGFHERTGKKYTKKQLSNHWDIMKNDWILFKNLMRGESGLGWDAIRNTIDADASWRDAKIQILLQLDLGHKLQLKLMPPMFKDLINMFHMKLTMNKKNVTVVKVMRVIPSVLNHLLWRKKERPTLVVTNK